MKLWNNKLFFIVALVFTGSFFFGSSTKAEIIYDSIAETPSYLRDISGEPDESRFGFVWNPTATTTINLLTLGLKSINGTPAYNQYIEVYQLTSLNQFPTDNLRVATSTNFFEVGTLTDVETTNFYFNNITIDPNKYYAFISNYPATDSYSPSQPISYNTLDTVTCTDGTNPCRRSYAKSGSVVGTSDEILWGRIGYDGSIFATKITAVTSPVVQAQTNNVTYSISLYNGIPNATQFCVQAYNNFQSMLPQCSNITASGSITASQTIYYPNNGSYFADLEIKDSLGVTIDKKSVNFYVNASSTSFPTPTSTETGLTNEFVDLIEDWTCNISIWSAGDWDPCAVFGSFVSDFLLAIWNVIINFFTGWIHKPPFGYLGQIYSIISVTISAVQEGETEIPTLAFDYHLVPNQTPVTITLFQQSTLTSVINQSGWDIMRPYFSALLYFMFIVSVWHRVKSIFHNVHK